VKALRSLLPVLVALGCRTAPEAAGPRIPVLVSVAPQAELVQQIGGDRVAVEVLLPPGSSDEDVSPSPRKALQLARARLYVKVGHPSFAVEAQYVDPFLARHPDVRVVDMSQSLPISPDDPHVWTAPASLAAGAQNIASSLAGIDPTHTDVYRANLARVLARIDRLDREIRARLSQPGAGRAFLVYHPSWGYFARQYGLEQIAIEAEGKEPGAARLIQLIDQARQDGARVVLVPGGFPQESARVLADAIDGRIVVADALAPDWQETLLRVASALGEESDA
jgi:zinc transport system substrate-binding protein